MDTEEGTKGRRDEDRADYLVTCPNRTHTNMIIWIT